VLLLSDIQWRELPQDDRLRNVRRVVLGVALATPVLVVFAALFASADQVFSNVLTNLFAFDAETVISHTFFIGFWAFLVAGTSAGRSWVSHSTPSPQNREPCRASCPSQRRSDC